MRLYNTMAHSKQEFTPRAQGKVAMYVCGPTVYNHIHIGNARTFLSFDIIRRYLEWRGYDVTFVSNLTDVDDKIIRRAAEEGTTPSELAEKYATAFIDVMHALGVEDPTVQPRATQEISGMIELVGRLIDSGHAYATFDGDVYFSVRSFPQYGKLSGRNIDELEGGHRELASAADESIADRKQDPLDFALWKAAKPGEPSWPSPWGEGRPGWHIECSVMSEKYLGLPFDIHGGGGDLVFPHHENEIAQSEAASGVPFANYWMHTGMLTVDGEKMSKSVGNFVLLKDSLAEYPSTVLRMLSLQTHYRSVLDYSPAQMDGAQVALERITTCVRNARFATSALDEVSRDAAAVSSIPASAVMWPCGPITERFPELAIDHPVLQEKRLVDACLVTGKRFVSEMDDDFNTASALGAIFTLVTEVNVFIHNRLDGSEHVGARVVETALDIIVVLMGVFGIDIALKEDALWPHDTVLLGLRIAGYTGEDPHAAVDALLEARDAARSQGQWDVADAVRDGLVGLGFIIEDTPQGARVIYKGRS